MQRRKFIRNGVLSAVGVAIPLSFAPGAMRRSGRAQQALTSTSGWVKHPLTSTLGGAAEPPLPRGVELFTVDAPRNPNGPVVHLRDFGAVADGAEPPSSGPDRNLAALEAALRHCRDVGASKLVADKGVYRIASGKTIVFDSLTDFTFDGGGATFLFHLIQGGAGVSIKNCQRSVFSNFNLDWDCAIDPPAWVGRVTELAENRSNFVMRFETAAPLDPEAWVTMNPLDEDLRAPGAGTEFDGFAPTKIEKLDAHTVCVWPKNRINPIVGQLYLLRHYTYEKHAVVMGDNSHLSFRNVNIYTFPGEGFVTGGDQHHFELVNCRIAPPANERRPITTTADGFHVMQSQGFIRLEQCEFSFMGDDCVNIHDNIHMGFRRVDDYTLVATNYVDWRCPFSPGDPVEFRNADLSPTDFTAELKSVGPDSEKSEVTLVFSQKIPTHIADDAILFNRRYSSHNVIVRNCYFHENRARGILCNSADWLVEDNRFIHNQYAAMLLKPDVSPGLWAEGFGARNVIIRGNKFESSNSFGADNGPAIQLGATVREVNTAYPLLDGVLLEENEFTEMPGPAVDASSFKDLVIRKNRVTNLKEAPVAKEKRGSIRAELGTGLWVEGNVWTTQKDIEAPILYYNADTAHSIVCRDNELKS
ncbi:right-handed parallel beta-helix repeat-containing protein [Kitasatospora sp. NPDC098652]|uniref:right-handed parallel beta-helix repeat-containing protein n=1 Tax=Kitasatospora sp. NPDC098652 TaxID=3364095 RepID=UPI00382035CC